MAPLSNMSAESHLTTVCHSLLWCQVVFCNEGLQQRLLRHGSLWQWALPERVLRQLTPANTRCRILVQQACNEILKGHADIWKKF